MAGSLNEDELRLVRALEERELTMKEIRGMGFTMNNALIWHLESCGVLLYESEGRGKKFGILRREEMR